MSSKDPYKSIFGSNATDRSVMTPDELDLMDGLCQEADKHRHLTMERASVVLIARLARELGDCRKRATTSPSLGKRSELPDHLRGEERELYIHRHDCPVAWASYDKHVLGLLERPSCFACGNIGDRAVEHLELADIYICVTCKTKLDAHAAPSPSLGEPAPETAGPTNHSANCTAMVRSGEACTCGFVPVASPTAARELNLKWGRHDARGEWHIEWHAPCGCAYHPEPKPHVHPCIKHAEIDQCAK